MQTLRIQFSGGLHSVFAAVAKKNSFVLPVSRGRVSRAHSLVEQSSHSA